MTFPRFMLTDPKLGTEQQPTNNNFIMCVIYTGNLLIMTTAIHSSFVGLSNWYSTITATATRDRPELMYPGISLLCSCAKPIIV